MLHEQSLIAMADAYRDMARRALALTLRIEFSERAERYEAVAAMVKRRREPPPPRPSE